MNMIPAVTSTPNTTHQSCPTKSPPRTEYVVNNAGQAYKIFALSCWNRTSYGSGYAVISVYKDLNGTIGFLIWGTTGQDTYYTSWVLWNTILGEKLQHEPPCLTTLILKFDYTKHPTASGFWKVAEALGTISEYNGPSILGIAQGPIHWDP